MANNNPKKPHKKKGRKADKIGRNKHKCERYRAVGRRERNRDRRMARIASSLARAAQKREMKALRLHATAALPIPRQHAITG